MCSGPPYKRAAQLTSDMPNLFGQLRPCTYPSDHLTLPLAFRGERCISRKEFPHSPCRVNIQNYM